MATDKPSARAMARSFRDQYPTSVRSVVHAASLHRPMLSSPPRWSAPSVTEPLCSILIAAHNAVSFLDDSISSALGQTYARVEVVVIDDGSTDGSDEVIRRFGSSIRTVRTANQGTANARNLALKISSGEIVALLDHDDVWSPGRLEICVERLQRSDKVGFVTTDAIIIDDHGRPSGARFYSGQRRFPTDGFREAILASNYIYASAVMWRNLLVQCGGFDPSAPVGCDDYDLWLKAILRGANPALETEALASYRIHSGNLSGNSDQMEEGRLLLLERHLPDYWKQGVFGEGHDAWSIGERLLSRGERARASRFLLAASRSPGKPTWQRVKTVAAVVPALMSRAAPQPID